MKKLTFALACASTFALFADIIVPPEMNFENYTAGLGLTAADQTVESSLRWLYMATDESTDESTVKAYGEGTAPSDAGSNYLNLKTGAGTLWRSLAQADSAASTLGEAQTLTSDVYVDTLVQFEATGSEDSVTTGTDDKIAIWLQGTTSDDNVESYTLCVKAAQANDDGSTSTFSPTVYTLTRADGQTLTVAPSTWYRLTVKAIADCDQRVALNPTKYETSVTGFQIYLDGVLLKATTATFADGYLTLALNANAYGWLSENDPAYALMTSATVFPSLVGAETSGTLQGVGFKGEGKIDNLSIGTEDPLEVPSLDCTLTWAEGLTAVSYQIGEADPVTENLARGLAFKAPAGTVVTMSFKNADGVTKSLTATVGENGGAVNFDTAPTYVWADYLGDAVENVYLIDSADEFVLFQKGVTTLGSEGVSFALSTDIALTEATPGIGVQNAKTLIASGDTYATFTAGAFKGTFDGQNHTVSGVILPCTDYAGLFQSAYNATIKNLKVSLGNATGFSGTEGDFGGGVIAGVAVNTTIENCSTVIADEYNAFTATKDVAGIVGYAGAGTILKDCVNNLAITTTGENVAAGLIACAAGTVTIKGTCAQNGTVTSAGTAYSIIAPEADATVTIETDAVITTTQTAIAPSSVAVDGLNFATITETGATFKFNAAAVAGANLKVMMGGQTITLANVGDSITLDTTLASATVTTTAENAEITLAENVYTVTEKAAEDWPAGDDLEKIADTATAKDEFGLTDDDPLAQANAKTLAVWAAANSVPFADRKTAFVGDANVTTVKAFLLNVAPADEATEEAAFKITAIAVATDGTATITVPEKNTADKAFNGKVEIRGCATLTGDYTTTAVSDGSARFFKAFIVVK